jgi:hypothetical protein
MQLRTFIGLIATAIGVGTCSQEPDYTAQQRACIVQHYSSYDAKKLSQCVDICISCMKGNVVTCNTSCKLKGAI